MAVQGMDVDQVRQVANWLNEMSNEVEQYTQRATAMVQSLVGTSWQGPDAEHFRAEFAEHARPSLHQSIEILRELVNQARREVAQQEMASQA
jgi:WXG100 family type VII secretion target